MFFSAAKQNLSFQTANAMETVRDNLVPANILYPRIGAVLPFPLFLVEMGLSAEAKRFILPF